MLNWLRDRELGKTVNRKTIYENMIFGPKFAFRGILNYGTIQNEREFESLDWTNDGNHLVSLDIDLAVAEGDSVNKITIWENPNTATKQGVKSNIDLYRSGIHPRAFITSMQCHNSKLILGGDWEDADIPDDHENRNKFGVIYFISLFTGAVEEVIRHWFVVISLKLDFMFYE